MSLFLLLATAEKIKLDTSNTRKCLEFSWPKKGSEHCIDREDVLIFSVIGADCHHLKETQEKLV